MGGEATNGPSGPQDVLDEEVTEQADTEGVHPAEGDAGLLSRVLQPRGGRTAALISILRGRPRVRLVALMALIVLTLAGIAATLAAWYFGYTWLWNFGFKPLSWNAVPAALGMLFLVNAWVIAYLPIGGLNAVLQLYVDEQEEAQLVRQFQDARSRQEALEERLTKEDQGNLVTVLRYSQETLREYYAIGLVQTQRSFRYSVVAMWLGFFILLAGLAVFIFPVEQIGLRAPATEVNTLVIVSGVIVEFISALFLWVYRRSIRQLTYFYNRQIHIHNILLCSRISDTMSDPDTPKRLIVEHVLQRVWTPEGIEAPTGKGLLSFLDRPQAVKAD